MQWICYEVDEDEVVAVPYPWSKHGRRLTDLLTLAAIARTSMYNPADSVIVTADTAEEAIAEVQDQRTIKAAAHCLRTPIGNIMACDDGLLHDVIIDTIDEAMNIHYGVQAHAAKYLGISARALNHHIGKKPELQHWREELRKRNQ